MSLVTCTSIKQFEYSYIFANCLWFGCWQVASCPAEHKHNRALLSLLFFSGISIRQVLLILIGYIIVLTITSIVFSFRGNLSYLVQVFQNSAFEFQLISIEEAKQVLLFYSPALLFGIIGLYKVVGNPKIRAHAQKIQQTTLIWLFFSLIAITNFPAYNRINFVLLLPPLAYLGLNLFYLIKKKLIKLINLLIL